MVNKVFNNNIELIYTECTPFVLLRYVPFDSCFACEIQNVTYVALLIHTTCLYLYSKCNTW